MDRAAQPVKPLVVGTSGWSYPEWKDGFYKGVPRRAWLEHLSRRFTGVEVNATFYRRMTPETFAKWHAATPDDFAFSLKGPQLVTHRHRLRNVARPVAETVSGAANLGQKLATVLWQLPPDLVNDPPLLLLFLEILAAVDGPRHVVEFRHESWFDDDTAAALTHFGVANCLSDATRWPLWDAVTTDLVYLRLHGHEATYASEYGEPGLAPWVERIKGWRAQGRAVHVYFDNDVGGAAPRDAALLMGMLGVARETA